VRHQNFLRLSRFYMKSLLLVFVVLSATLIPLQAKSLEIREFTVRAELASGNFLSKDESLLLDKGLIACNQKLSLRIPTSGKIGYRETKALPYGSSYDKQGNPGAILTADVGVIFSGKLEKHGAAYALQFKYNHTSLMDNAMVPSHGALRIFQPEFQDIEIDSGGVTLTPNQWLILGGFNKESGVTNLIAIKLVQ
jgi:hypothetical protein